ncbi:RHS repeat domain-containing protein [Paenibacillus agricola]|uniref:Teneurin-like YD-shell domain-containing protein n=1 Tax=Paenibacillus agricola TaxID=2716264 RepID=A0ABX0JI83_9BACL|nr:RHS repeat-associated core domain-containing protein [Paenibacillus agricola]NHN34677.1 hypothetical protein [Paenibacillus agricola]
MVHKKADGAVINSYSYGYDANANITSKTENGVASAFGYDVLDRITSATAYNQAYSYNSRGNRATMQSDYAPSMESAEYAYDASDRLTQVQEEVALVNYRYNGDGQLVERTENGVTMRYYYDNGNLVADGIVAANGAVSLNARYIRGNGLAARAAADGSQAYYLSNGHGDIVELRDATGNTRLNKYAYDLWGNLTESSEQVANPFKYSGEFWDNSTSLQYLRARWYDPSVGRFMNQDTYEGDINNPLSLNLYTYGHNNPLKYNDPSGHNPAIVEAAVIVDSILTSAIAGGVAGGSTSSKTDEYTESAIIIAVVLWFGITDKISSILSSDKTESNRLKKDVGRETILKVKSKEDAEKILKEGKPKLEEKERYTEEKYKDGYEHHPAEPNVGNNLPHIKWKEWSGGKSKGADGHIFGCGAKI